MNDVQEFYFQGNPIRTLLKDQELWFVALDVCKALGTTNTTVAVSRLDVDERDFELVDTPGGPKHMVTISESGLYYLVFTSRKPEAKEFQRWVKEEILPTFRKESELMTFNELEKFITDPDTVIQIAEKLKQEMKKRVDLEKELKETKRLLLFSEDTGNASNVSLFQELNDLINRFSYEVE